MVTTTPPPATTRTDRVARLLTEVFAPAVQATVMPLVIGAHATPRLLTGLGWGLLAVLFSAVIPYGIIWVGVRRGQLTDHHIGVREQRRRPLIYALLSVIAGLVVLVLLGAPRPLVAMVVVMLAVLGGVTAVNQVWKLSAHAAVSAGTVAVLVVVFGPWALTAVAVAAAVGWSRIRLRDHTATQVAAGYLVGVAVALPAYLPIA